MAIIEDEIPGLERYQRALETYRAAQSKCATAAQLYVETWLSIGELKIYVEELKATEKEFNDANFCYTHPERAHERE